MEQILKVPTNFSVYLDIYSHYIIGPSSMEHQQLVLVDIGSIGRWKTTTRLTADLLETSVCKTS